jgi:hypothetical protein
MYEASKLMRSSMNSQKATHESAGRQRNPLHDVCFLIINIQAKRVALVSSVITKIFNSCKYWTVTIQPYVETISNSVSALLVASL